jgi:SAM-dependent methyltransferase
LLTVDFDRLEVGPGDRLLDLGCGTGRHSFEALKRGADVIALDLNEEDLRHAGHWMAAIHEAGESADAGHLVRADALRLPFADAAFDKVIASEVLEHIPEDRRAITELGRVLKPGGRLAISVPRWFSESVCWALSDEYHSNPGGHVRIYRGDELAQKLRAAGFDVVGEGFAHALHSPYWWLRCLLGENAPLAAAYHRMLVWDIERGPAALRAIETALNPVLGKSLVLYLSHAA